MSPIKSRLETLIEYLPEDELRLLLEIAEHFVADDVATPEDIAAIEAADQDYQNGEMLTFDQIDWNT